MSVSFGNDGLSETPEQKRARETAGVEIDYIRYRRFYDPAYDFPFTDWGTFAGVRTGSGRDAGASGQGGAGSSGSDRYLVYGLRVSPARLLYGTIAPDLLIAPHDLGFGVSAYAPVDVFGSRFNHWGLGIGRLFSTAHSGGTATIVYASFSTKDL